MYYVKDPLYDIFPPLPYGPVNGNSGFTYYVLGLSFFNLGSNSSGVTYA